MNEQQIESEIQAKGLTAYRVTPEDIDDIIVGDDYHVFPGTTVTVCCLKLKNGFVVVGQSACISPANFDAELGRSIARSRARQKIWDLVAYAAMDLGEDLYKELSVGAPCK